MYDISACQQINYSDFHYITFRICKAVTSMQISGYLVAIKVCQWINKLSQYSYLQGCRKTRQNSQAANHGLLTFQTTFCT
jgi:hypothetical protein